MSCGQSQIMRVIIFTCCWLWKSVPHDNLPVGFFTHLQRICCIFMFGMFICVYSFGG